MLKMAFCLARLWRMRRVSRWLLDHGADPNARGAINPTALSDAVHFAPSQLYYFSWTTVEM